jgi:hypothetical protein
VEEWVTRSLHFSTQALHCHQAAQWGADQELEACCEWLFESAYPHKVASVYAKLRAARRPKPPSLKEQALERLELAKKYVDVEPIRRALEALDD